MKFGQPKNKQLKLNKTSCLPALWLLPMCLFLLAFIFLPLLVTVFDSLFEVSLLDTASRQFVGLSNYKTVLMDSNVQRSFSNTMFYLVISLLVETVLGIAIALILLRKFKGRGLIIGILMIPWALPPLVNGILWRFIFDPTNGLWNSFLFNLGFIESFQVWLNNPVFSKWCVIIVHIWKMLPLITVLFIARLQTLPEDILEASQLDGAGGWQQFKTIIFPHIRPILFITLAQGSIGAFHLFDEAYAMTGTALDTRSLLIQDYLTAFREYNLGTGMALALVISLLILLCMLVFAKISRRQGS